MDGGHSIQAELLEDTELDPIRALCSGPVTRHSEGNKRYIYMRGLNYLHRGVEAQQDALLCLNHDNPTYPTKLYFTKKVEGAGLALNWNEAPYILGKSWNTWSWRDVAQHQPPIMILAQHLRAFQ